MFKIFHTTSRFWIILISLWLCLLAIFYASLSILHHARFESGGFDLGIYDQAVWQFSRFQYPFNTIKNRLIFGDHLSLTLPLLATLYWLRSDVRMLLVFQSFWLVLSIIPVYKLIRHRGYSAQVASILCIIYSLFYAFQQTILFDFHAAMIGVGLVAWVLYFFETRKGMWLSITFILLLLTQENMGLELAAIMVIYLFKKKYRAKSFALIVSGIVFSFLAIQIVARLSPLGYDYVPRLNANTLTLLSRFFDDPQKRQVWLYSFSWFSFLPLLSPGAILASALELGQYFITGPEFSRMWSPFTHHRIMLAPIMLLGTLDAFVFLKKKKIFLEKVSLGMLFVMLVLQFIYHLPLNKLSKSEYWRQEPWMKDDAQLISLISPVESIATQQDLVPHLSQRKEIYLVYPVLHDYDDKRCGQRQCWWLDFAGKPDYLLVDLRQNQWVTQVLESSDHMIAAVENMEKTEIIRLVIKIGNLRYYRLYY